MTRVANSILNLASEVHHRSPSTIIYFYDDDAKINSDHDPNPAGVVCACDIMSGHGLNLQALADEILARRHPALKYIIYNRRIASARTGWKWVEYTGSNPHTDHIHVSVGVGPDGYSTGPYDNDEPWLGGGDMELTDKVRYVKGPGVSYSADAVPLETILGQTLYYLLWTRNQLIAATAADETRDQALQRLVQAIVSGGGNVETAAIVGAINAATSTTNSKVAGLQAEIDGLHAALADRDRRLALAYGQIS